MACCGGVTDAIFNTNTINYILCITSIAYVFVFVFVMSMHHGD